MPRRWRVYRSKSVWIAYALTDPLLAHRFETWDAAMLYVNTQIGYLCRHCRHTSHIGRCDFPITEELRDDVGYGGVPPTGETRVMLVGTCRCDHA